MFRQEEQSKNAILKICSLISLSIDQKVITATDPCSTTQGVGLDF